MPIYDGLVTMSDREIPVIVEIDEARVRLSASGTEIGEWSIDECTISHIGNATYAISAENETLTFVPSQPTLFAAAVDNGGRAMRTESQPAADTGKAALESDVVEAPPPRPLTLGLFYVLCLVTLALATWSLATIVF